MAKFLTAFLMAVLLIGSLQVVPYNIPIVYGIPKKEFYYPTHLLIRSKRQWRCPKVEMPKYQVEWDFLAVLVLTEAHHGDHLGVCPAAAAVCQEAHRSSRTGATTAEIINNCRVDF